jgi:arylsulfatase A-like enzyme
MQYLRFAAAFTLTIGLSASARAQERPNVVLIVADYMGYGDIGPYGATDIRTPSLDRLARSGVRFTNAYAPAPICSPSRVGLLTGRYPQRAGFNENVGGPGRPPGLPTSETTIARPLKDSGYTTALFGKWHLGLEPAYSPNQHGFEEFFGFLDWSIDYYSHRTEAGAPGLYENGTPVEVEGYATELFTDRAVAFIERNRERPYFLYVAYNAALPPHQPPNRPDDVRSAETWFHGTREDYIEVVEALDTGIGRILDAVDRETLVIFTYDHGGKELGRTTPLFHGFRTLWEGGIRVPLIMSWPGKIPSGLVSEQLSINMDLSATILAAARISSNRELDGIDLIPILEGKMPPTERTLFWRTDYPAYKQRAVRRGRYKYLVDDTTYFLFDLEADIGERNNLAHRQPEILEELQDALARWEGSVSP